MADFDKGPINVNDIAKKMEMSDSYWVIVKNWQSFATFLGVKEVKLLDLERKLKLGDVQLESIPREVLKIWIAQKGSDANWQVLRRALVDCGAKVIAESLEPPSVEASKFIWPKKVMTLERLLGKSTPGKCLENISEKCDLNKEPMQLLKHNLNPCKPPPFYVPRTFVCSAELDLKVFNSDLIKDHVFVFKGINKHDLARASNHQAIDESGNQLDDLTVNLILLECDEDFDKICKHSKKAIHIVQHNSGHFFLVKSNRGLEAIRPYLRNEETKIRESELVSMISALAPPCSLSIADSPGMGKTFVLTNLAFEIQQKFPKGIVLFIVLQEFVQQMSIHKDSSSSIDTLAEYSTTSYSARLKLKEMLRKDSNQFYVFLDGYDEITQDKLDLADSLLKQLSQLKNAKLILTTRLHFRNRVETISNQLSLKLQPFNEDNQVHFLTRYWIEEHQAKENKILEKFARQCLLALMTNLSDEEKAITEVPLQCWMLAEVFGENAKRASKLQTLREDTVKPMSFFGMYKKLVDLKLERIADPSLRETYVSAHVYEAMKLLFPWSSEVIGQPEIDEVTLYSIGLIERSPHENSPRFVHRTFAEYILAEFIVKNLGKYTACVDLFFWIIFGRKGTLPQGSPAFHSFLLSYHVVAYFIEMHLKENRKSNSVDDLLPLVDSKSRLFSRKDICTAIVACACNDLENAFEFATKTMRCFNITEILKDTHFKNLPHIVIKKSKNVRMLEKTLDFTNLDLKVSIDFHTIKPFQDYGGYHASQTLLHTAAREGKYNMVTYSLNYYGDEVRNFNCLLHECVAWSAENSQSTIEEKLLIMDIFVKINPGWLEKESAFSAYSPLLAPSAHIILLKKLVEHGASINDMEPSSIHKATKTITQIWFGGHFHVDLTRTA